MNDDQLLRYSRQIMLPQMDIEGQQKLLQSHVLIVGLGGLGSPVAMYLAAAGVGTLTLADFDQVDLSNLQRQIAHSHSSIGLSKADSASQTLNALNPETQIHTIIHKLDGDELVSAVEKVDLVIDASDNFSTRFAINQACAKTRTPLVSGAAIRLEGQVSVFLHQRDDQPCYHCLYTDNQEDETATCSESGVLSPVVGIIGSIQATEAIKLLAGIGSSLTGRLLTLDASTMEFREIRLRKDPACPVCSKENHAKHQSAVS